MKLRNLMYRGVGQFPLLKGSYITRSENLLPSFYTDSAVRTEVVYVLSVIVVVVGCVVTAGVLLIFPPFSGAWKKNRTPVAGIREPGFRTFIT